MYKNEKTVRPFGLQFVTEIPRERLDEAVGGINSRTEALSLGTFGPKDHTVEDQF